jgi:hypothetical protein
MTRTNAFPGIHLVGSMPFETGEEVFDLVSERLRDWVRRVPDETGDRAAWITLQLPLIVNHPMIEMVPPAPDAPVPMPLAQLRPDADPAELEFPEFAYGPAAAESHGLLAEAKRQGLISDDARLLVAMPTGHNPVGIFVAAESRDPVLTAYERQLRHSVDQIQAAVPHSELAIQWDLVSELTAMGGGGVGGRWDRDEVIEELRRLASWVQPDVELGFHLCFGDSNRDNVRPGQPSPFKIESNRASDATPLRELATAIFTSVSRPIQFMHMAIPIDWTGPAQFEPLSGLKVRDETELYLGVVHPQDRLEPARRRARIATETLGRPIGIGTECGMGRYGTQEKFMSAIDTLAGLAEELS